VAREWTVPPELDGWRLDKAVVKIAEGMSRARVRRAIDDGLVRVGGRHRSKGATVAAGEILSIEMGEVPSPDAPAVPTKDAPLVVRLERPDILVVDKPAGQPTAPLRADETGTLANALVGHYPELAGVGYGPREPGLLHRLDTGTSGLVVVARSAAVFEVLRDALRDGRLRKKYLLVCASHELPDTATIEHPLANHPKDSRRVLACIHPRDVMRLRPRQARTELRVLDRGEKWAIVEALAPKALRHQIRAHFASIEHPLAGDVLYGGEPVAGLDRHALHASHVSFDGAPGVPAFEADSPLPEELRALV
jgi:23S rRNA pseudouridine1911/1915/1917 synthase